MKVSVLLVMAGITVLIITVLLEIGRTSYHG